MKAIQVSAYVNGPEDLKVTELPDPIPAPGEYLIQIRASAANFFDLLQIRGKYQNQPPFPWISGTEFAGTVIAAGSSAKRFKVGDRVFGAKQGAYATKICAAEPLLHPVPERWGFDDAAGLYVTAPTSYQGLVGRAGVKKGDWVLVHAGAGGVSLAAIQIAKYFGAKVIATASSHEKLGICKKFGADYAIDYSKGTWSKSVLEITNGKGVDIVYDPVGLVEQSLKCIAWNGRILIVGFAGGKIEKVAMNRVLLKNVSLVGLHWGRYPEIQSEKRTVEDVWSGILGMIKDGGFKPTVYRGEEFVGLESVPRALKALGARETWGKVVISVPKEGESRL
ncbi:unnamed protein product [Tuber aestivum]|uniref:Enoyl reductase (ER) domain-containing protein n=1 Tax=Tuber aestivum TaxID=59557 RepID=A0A292Q7S6_9PEZI|nr:unnamed protein product [Tuber aestivum]